MRRENLVWGKERGDIREGQPREDHPTLAITEKHCRGFQEDSKRSARFLHKGKNAAIKKRRLN